MNTFKVISFGILFILPACSTVQAARIENSDMDYVEICRTAGDCNHFSRLVMGTDHLIQANWSQEGRPEISDKELADILDEAVRLGINFFDTSPIYVGGVENKLGKWIQSRKVQIQNDDFYTNKSLNPDRELYTLSKGGFPYDLHYSKQLDSGTHSKELMRKLQDAGVLNQLPSLTSPIPLAEVPPGTYASRLYGNQEQIVRRVTDELAHTTQNLNFNITMYLMHRDDGDFFKFNEIRRPKTPVATIMKALSDPEISKHFWGLGWSNWETARINESLRQAQVDPSLTKPMMNSPYFSLFEMSQRSIHAGGVQVTHDEMMDPQFQKGIKIMSYSPLGGFSILDKPEPKWENGKKAAKKKYDEGDPYWQNVYHSIFTPENEARYHRVVEFTAKFNKERNTDYTVDQMINAYALAHERADFLAIGPITIEQLRRTVGSLKLSRMLTKKDLEYLYRGL